MEPRCLYRVEASAWELAETLRTTVSRLDELDGKKDNFIEVDILQKLYPDRFVRVDLSLKYLDWIRAGTTTTHYLYFVDNGDGLLEKDDLVLYFVPSDFRSDTQKCDEFLGYNARLFSRNPLALGATPIIREVERSVEEQRESWLFFNRLKPFDALKRMYPSIQNLSCQMAVSGIDSYYRCGR